MEKINYLESRPSSRYDDYELEQGGNKNTKFADLIIDVRSLYQMLRSTIWFRVSDGVVKRIKDK